MSCGSQDNSRGRPQGRLRQSSGMRGWTLEEGEEQPAQFWTPPTTARPPRPAPHPITLQNQSVLSTSKDAGLSLVFSRPPGSALPAPTALREHRCWTFTRGLSNPKVWILSPEWEVSNSELQPLSQTQDCQLQAPPEDVLVPDFSPLQPGILRVPIPLRPQTQESRPPAPPPSDPGVPALSLLLHQTQQSRSPVLPPLSDV